MPILTIDSARLNGTPSAGTVRIKASRSPLMDSGNNTVYSGTQTFPLDKNGKLSVSLPATDSPSLGAPFTYTVEANLASGQWIYRGVKLPANVATIDITDAQSASHQVYPTRQEWDAITAGMNTAIAGKVTGTGMTVRHDTTVGERVLLDHPGGTTMLSGDTGWRNITSLIATPSLTPSQPTLPLRIKRVGDRVTLAGSLKNESSETFVDILAFPTGFHPANPYHTHGVGRCGANPTFFNSAFSFTILRATGTIAANVAIEFEISWTTSQAWPATLPGLPA